MAASLSVGLVHTNNFAGGQAGNESLLLDGESSRAELNYQLPVSRCWSLITTVPLIAHTEGFLDTAIESWHSVFQLPNAQRETQPANQLRIIYESDEVRQIDIADPASGVGDVQIAAAYHANCKRSPGWGLSAGLKLPTGSFANLTGSGGSGVFIDALMPKQRLGQRLSLQSLAGLMLQEQGDIPLALRPWVAYGSVALQYRLLQRWFLATQLDWNTALYDSQLRELGKGNGNLALSIMGELNHGLTVHLGFQEDIYVDTSPDFGIFFTVAHRR